MASCLRRAKDCSACRELNGDMQCVARGPRCPYENEHHMVTEHPSWAHTVLSLWGSPVRGREWHLPSHVWEGDMPPMTAPRRAAERLFWGFQGGWPNPSLPGIKRRPSGQGQYLGAPPAGQPPPASVT